MKDQFLVVNSTNGITITKKINRSLGIFLLVIGITFNLVYFYYYLIIIGLVDTDDLFGILFFENSYLPILEILLLIGGGFLIGGFYFSFWFEGWKTINISKEIRFIYGLIFYKWEKSYQQDSIIKVYIEKIPLDELNLNFLYKLVLEYSKRESNKFLKKILLSTTNRDQIHDIGKEVLKIFPLDTKLDYKTIQQGKIIK